LMAATNNATGGKGPCFGHAQDEGKREGLAGKTGPNYPGEHTLDEEAREPLRELRAAAERFAHAALRRPSVSRVREIRTHGLNGGSALRLLLTQ